MSGYARVRVDVLSDASVSSPARLLYCLIVALSGEQGFAWASNDYLATRVGCTGRTVRRLLAELVERRLVVVEFGEGGKRRVSPLALVDSGSSGVDMGVRPPRTLVSAGVDTGVRPPRTLVSTEYAYLNTIKNTAVSANAGFRNGERFRMRRECFVAEVRKRASNSRAASSNADPSVTEAVDSVGGWSSLGRMSSFDLGKAAEAAYRFYSAVA